ncbi:scavenger receptor cysteine-rich type 1 protein M130 [Tautogolabrus adspersus]
MWFLLLLVLFNALVEPLKVHAKKVILQGGKGPCEGHIKVFHNNDWGYVGDTIWNNSIEEVVCRSTHCGKPETNSSGFEGRPTDSNVWLNEVRCKGNENDLLKCDYPGWDLKNFRDDFVRTIKCSNKIKLSLEGYKCAGAVRYSTDNETDQGYFCEDNFGEAEADLLCSSLKCGKSKKINKYEWFGGKGLVNQKMMKIKCYNTTLLTHLWQCVDEETSDCKKPASVICTGSKRVQLKGSGSNVCSGRLEKEENETWTPVKNETTSPHVWCQQMHCGTSVVSENEVNVTCSDNVTVVLMDNNKESKCYGAVHVKVNSMRYPVCASTWTKKEAQVVCSEKNCGSVVAYETKKGNAKQGIMDYMECLGSESSLWHCFGQHKPFECDTKAYVVCSDSINVRLADSPGRCAGRVEIQHEGKWQRVNEKAWDDTNSKVVCNHLKCGNERRNSNPEDKYSQGSSGFLPVTVKCRPNALHISECMTNNLDTVAKEKEAVRITCEKHKVVFLDGVNSCSGMVGIEQGNETFWLSGSSETWTQEQADTVCRQMHCNKAFNFSFTSNADMKKRVWNESYSCSSNPTSLFECKNTAKPLNHSDTIATVICKGNIKVDLTQKCWGNVNICMGEECGGVCDDTWTEKKSEMLCEHLKCGHAILHAKSPPQESKASFKSMHATKHTKDISQCNFIKNDEKTCKGKAASVVCSESVDTRMNAIRDKCCGNVEVFYESQWLPVCKEALEDNESKNIICGEWNCGQAVEMHDFFGPKHGSSSISGIKCPSGVKSLKECNITSNKTPCNLAGLECSHEPKITLYPKCGGEVKINNIGVCNTSWNIDYSDLVCLEMGCTKAVGHFYTDPDSKMEYHHVRCEKYHSKLGQCKRFKAKCHGSLVSVYCVSKVEFRTTEKFGGKIQVNYRNEWENVWYTKPEEQTTPIVPVILGVGFLLVLVVATIVFMQIRKVRKDKRARNVTSRMMSRKEVEFESGDYEDVNSKANEMEDLSRFRPEAEIITESDAQSTPSLPYDDVDEPLVEARSLTSQAAFAVVSGDNLNFEDQVAYEVDDPRESYDDIDYSPQITQTKAEVHDGPRTTPGGVPAEPARLLKWEEDYLEPGQNG